MKSMHRLFCPRVLAFAAATLLLAGCVSHHAVKPPTQGVPHGAERLMIPMPDGVRLEADCYIPPEGGPFPVIASRTVYRKNGDGGLGRTLAEKGIAFVIQDTRGRGGSQGEDRIFADDGWGEHADGADTVEWIAKQKWCNGRIGTFGGSALGITQVLMAPATPKVWAQAIWVASDDLYDGLAYQGGVFHKHLCETWTRGQHNDAYLPVWKSHPCKDAFWAQFDAGARAGDVTAAGIHVGGWFDIFCQGTIDCFTARQHNGGERTDKAPGARNNQCLIMGPWTHGGPNGKSIGQLPAPENFGFDIHGASFRFLEYWLRQAPSTASAFNEPTVRYYTLGEIGNPSAPGNEWREANDWPPFGTQETPFYLVEGGLLRTESPTTDNASVAYDFDPAHPCPTRGGANLYPDYGIGPWDQQELLTRPDVLHFATEPLTKPIEITGRVRVKLYVSTDAVDTDFAARLVDIYPDGRQMLMLDGIQRLKFRDGFEQANPLPRGEIGQVTIDLWTISLIMNTGHRIGVLVSSSNYPRFEVNPNTGADFPAADFAPVVEKVTKPEGQPSAETPAPATSLDTSVVLTAHNTVYMDRAHPSALILPVRP